MPHSCAASGCKNRQDAATKAKYPLITFHSFPKDEAVREEWVKAVRHGKMHKQQLWVPGPGARLCSQHFKEENFLGYGVIRRLQPRVVPSLFSYSQKDQKLAEIKTGEWMRSGRAQEQAAPSATVTKAEADPDVFLEEIEESEIDDLDSDLPQIQEGNVTVSPQLHMKPELERSDLLHQHEKLSLSSKTKSFPNKKQNSSPEVQIKEFSPLSIDGLDYVQENEELSRPTSLQSQYMLSHSKPILKSHSGNPLGNSPVNSHTKRDAIPSREKTLSKMSPSQPVVRQQSSSAQDHLSELSSTSSKQQILKAETEVQIQKQKVKWIRKRAKELVRVLFVELYKANLLTEKLYAVLQAYSDIWTDLDTLSVLDPSLLDLEMEENIPDVLVDPHDVYDDQSDKNSAPSEKPELLKTPGLSQSISGPSKPAPEKIVMKQEAVEDLSVRYSYEDIPSSPESFSSDDTVQVEAPAAKKIKRALALKKQTVSKQITATSKKSTTRKLTTSIRTIRQHKAAGGCSVGCRKRKSRTSCLGLQKCESMHDKLEQESAHSALGSQKEVSLARTPTKIHGKTMEKSINIKHEQKCTCTTFLPEDVLANVPGYRPILTDGETLPESKAAQELKKEVKQVQEPELQLENKLDGAVKKPATSIIPDFSSANLSEVPATIFAEDISDGESGVHLTKHHSVISTSSLQSGTIRLLAGDPATQLTMQTDDEQIVTNTAASTAEHQIIQLATAVETLASTDSCTVTLPVTLPVTQPVAQPGVQPVSQPRTSLQSTEGPCYLCGSCGTHFTTVEECIQHMITIHSTGTTVTKVGINPAKPNSNGPRNGQKRLCEICGKK